MPSESCIIDGMMSGAQHGSAPLMFSVSGCRGIVGESMTAETVCRFVGAYVELLRETGSESGGIVVGRDGRRGGSELHGVAIDEIRLCGYDAIDVGVAATPTVGVAVVEHAAAGGLVLTASHNPGEWNGLKPITAAGRAPTAEDAARLHEIFVRLSPNRKNIAKRGGVVGDVAATALHVRRVVDALSRVIDPAEIRRRQFRIAVDSVNASGAAGAALLAESLGCELVHINADGSGVFPHPPEPTREHLSGAGGLCDAVREHGSDAGFAQDPDADRLAIIDEHGCYIGEEYTLVFAADAVLSARGAGGVVAVNLSTSRMIDDIAASRGARVVRTPVGEAHVASAVAGLGADLGGEGNGGVIWPGVVLIRDSLGAMALTLALMARSGKKISQLVAETPAYAIVKRKAPLGAVGIAAALDAVAERWPGATLDRRDGVRVDLVDERAWVHVRASNTEPILRLIAEAPTEAAADRLLDEADAAVASGR